jgi:hypothetical protein
VSAPTSHDPLVVNTADGSRWVRRARSQDGRGLYALEGALKDAPEPVLASLNDLAEIGLRSMADVLPVPVGPEPQALSLSGPICSQAEARAAGPDIAPSVEELGAMASTIVAAGDPLSAEVDLARAVPLLGAAFGRLRARVAELEAERAKYVGKEPTIAEEMAYLSRCFHAVGELELPETLKVDSIDPQYRNGYVHALADMRTALESPERTSYPPALPWAALMDTEDLSEFLDELASSATTHASSEVVLSEVEDTIARWRLIGEAQHAHNTAPGPDERPVNGLTAVFAPTQVLREDVPPLRGRALLDALTVERAERTHNQRLGIEDVYESPLHHEYRVGHDLPETGGA